jgi:hypothetical protein
MKNTFHYKNWSVIYSLKDGARLNHLRFKNIDLLTTEPKSFKPPKTDYGLYETRPVYGYDDCFPTVDSCLFPEKNWTVPDHGELCWLNWTVTELSNRLIFSVKSKKLPVIFKRELRFGENELTWAFEVSNESEIDLPFMHVMHSLMPLQQIESLNLPSFERVFDEIHQKALDLKKPKDVKEYLLGQSQGTANMLLLQNVRDGKMDFSFKNGLSLGVEFPETFFPTIGIWWNNSGHPDEDGCRRNECAFEPIPGTTSVLSETYQDDTCLTLLPGQRFTWLIFWNIH